MQHEDMEDEERRSYLSQCRIALYTAQKAFSLFCVNRKREEERKKKLSTELFPISLFIPP